MDRPRGIGGSDAAAVVGLNPYRSPVQVWLEATGRVEPREAGEAAMWGNRLQPVLAEWLHEQGEYQVIPAPEEPIVSETHPFMFGTLDGYASQLGELGVAEIKTAGLRQSKQWDEDLIPLAYQVQGQHYLAVTGLPYVVYACLIGGQRFVVRRMERDDAIIALLIRQEEEFWTLVETDTPPAPDGSPATTAMLSRLYPDDNGAVCILDDTPELIEQLTSARDALAAAKTEEARAENAVKDRMRTASMATVRGVKVATWRAQTSRRVDVKRLKEELPNVWHEYAYESESRPFRVY